MLGKLLKALAYGASLGVALLLLVSSPYHQEYLSHVEEFPNDSAILFGVLVSLLMLVVHGPGFFVQAYVQQQPARHVLRSLNPYFTLFYLVQAAYWLYHMAVVPASA